MRVLALDCALRTGWAHNCGLGPDAGVEVFHAKDARRYRDFYCWLANLLDEIRPELVVVEAPVQRANGKAPRYLSIGFMTRVEEAAAIRKIPVREVYPSSLKKHATGSGRATKEQMRAAAGARFKKAGLVHIEDDNEADALLLLAMALDGFGERKS